MVERQTQSTDGGTPQPAPADGAESGEPAGARRRLHPDQKLLLLASAGVIVGSFLPWLSVASGLVIGGFGGAGIYTFYSGVLGFAGGLVPFRWMAITQGVIMAAIAISLTVWQVIHLINKVGFGGWLPGSGLIVVFASGLLALVASYRIWRDEFSG